MSTRKRWWALPFGIFTKKQLHTVTFVKKDAGSPAVEVGGER